MHSASGNCEACSLLFVSLNNHSPTTFSASQSTCCHWYRQFGLLECWGDFKTHRNALFSLWCCASARSICLIDFDCGKQKNLNIVSNIHTSK